MWTILVEQPLLVSIMIGVGVIGLFFAWLQSGDKRLAVAGLVAALLIPAEFYLANSVQTDREQILESIYATAEAVETNDHDAAVQIIGDPATRQQALAELPNYVFDRLSVRNVQLRFVEGSYPEEATVDLDASVLASQKRGSLQNIRVVRRVILTFQKQPDETWAVTEYTHMPLTGQPDDYTPNRTAY
jgi:hypothetical protein